MDASRRRFSPFVTLLVMSIGCGTACAQQQHKEPDVAQMLLRIAEIEIAPEFLNEYKTILKEEADVSVRLEPGVVAIFPMYRQEDPTQVRILEIYANHAAYESHLTSSHFQKYKTTTPKMVKSLKLVGMEAIDPGTMAKA